MRKRSLAWILLEAKLSNEQNMIILQRGYKLFVEIIDNSALYRSFFQWKDEYSHRE